MRRLRLVFALCALVAGLAAPALAGGTATSSPTPGSVSVLVVPIDGTVDDGMEHLVARAVATANAAGEPLVLDIDTPGGEVSSVFAIRDDLFRATTPTIAFVSGRAFSAGALIALACRKIVMAPGSSIGAAEPIVSPAYASHEPKFVSALAAEFRSTAVRNGRSGTLAAAMVDKHVDAPRWKAHDAILSLTADEAKRAGIADAVSPTLDGALADVGLAGAHAIREHYGFGERLARFATSSEVSGTLLAIGVLGLLIEMFTLHGIAGVLGVLALGLYFGSHLYMGFGDGLVVALAVAGVAGILVELHVLPGHVVPGVVGVLALGGAIALSFGGESLALSVQTLAIAVVLAVIGLVLLLRTGRQNAFVRRFAFKSEQGAEYVASRDFRDLVGATGTAASFLRPAGVAIFGERRVDVLTGGEFLPAGSAVRVARVEGARIFVEPCAKEVVS